MTERSQQAWLLRRAGFGPAAGQLDQLASAPVGNLLDRLVDPDAHGVPPAPDPWSGVNLDDRKAVVTAWLKAMVSTPRPLEEWMRWYWHGHLVAEAPVVNRNLLMVEQLRLFGRSGLGDFRSLLLAVTTDAATLLYLDGARNTRKQINENYSREVLELFALGIGNYGEDDVRAGAVALTGWTVPGDKKTKGSAFDPKRHDDTPQRFLGRTGVHDVPTVVDAIVSHPACAPFVTGRLARALLGPDIDPGLVSSLAADFARSGLALRPLVRAILEAGLDGHGSTLVRDPVSWLVAMIKATGANSAKAAAATVGLLRAAGQVPLEPPNVGGWPGGLAWMASSTTVARWNLATVLAPEVPTASAARAAAVAGDWPRLADSLGASDGLGAATVAGLDKARTQAKSKGDAALALAMSAPEVVLA